VNIFCPETAQVVSVKIEQVESEVDEPTRVPFRKLAAQCLEIGQSCIAEYRRALSSPNRRVVRGHRCRSAQVGLVRLGASLVGRLNALSSADLIHPLLNIAAPEPIPLKRIVSVAGMRSDSWKSVGPFKGIICADVSEFESDHPSHAVRSPPARLDYSTFLLWRGPRGECRAPNADARSETNVVWRLH
jgi:hypothetical protein